MTRLRTTVAVAACSALLFGCTADMRPGNSKSAQPDQPVKLSVNVTDKAADVGVDTLVTASAENGKVTAVTLASTDGKDKVPGTITDGRWTAADRLEPGLTYDLQVTGANGAGAEKPLKATFTTQKLTLAEQTYPSVAPLQGETVGVGMPIIVTFDVAVKDRELYEKNMHVTSSKAAEGSWSWFSDREVHYRPKEFWPAGSKVNVDLKLNGLPAGGGIYGQQDQDIDFTIGRKVVSVVDMDKHQLKYTVDGKTKRTLKVSTGDADHQTRDGIKVVMEKFSTVDMDAASTGVDSDDPGYYNMKDVRWAMRLTNSGEFLHAAPWNAAFFGNANRSHGCTGLSTADAGWLYGKSRRGDVVKYTGGTRDLEDRNGWTDWNESWADWTKGSALPPETTPTPSAPVPSSAAPTTPPTASA